MKLWPFGKKALSINQVIENIEAIFRTKSGVSVTPDNCMRSPTVHAIVTSISRRIAVSPVKVFKKTVANGRESKEPQPEHPISKLLNAPNAFQTRVNFWLDLGSQLVRYNNCYAWKGRGNTGPIRRLIPLHAGETTPTLDDNLNLTYKTTINKTDSRDFAASAVFHARGAARNFIKGDSPITDISEAIAMEIAAEQFGASFFGNGAVPLMVFQMMAGFKDWKTDEEKQQFLDGIREKLGGDKKHTAFLLPKGIELADKSKTSFDLNSLQFVDARKYQRTVIAGAFGVPPHLVGDLERATFNNVEQQDSDFTINVVLPYVRMLEAALERDLLSPQERNQGFIIRFNLNAIQRADFKTQQDGLAIQRQNGIISANEWREKIELNPFKDEEQRGDEIWMPRNFQLTSEESDDEPPPDDNRPPGAESAQQ